MPVPLRSVGLGQNEPGTDPRLPSCMAWASSLPSKTVYFHKLVHGNPTLSSRFWLQYVTA